MLLTSALMYPVRRMNWITSPRSTPCLSEEPTKLLQRNTPGTRRFVSFFSSPRVKDTMDVSNTLGDPQLFYRQWSPWSNHWEDWLVSFDTITFVFFPSVFKLRKYLLHWAIRMHLLFVFLFHSHKYVAPHPPAALPHMKKHMSRQGLLTYLGVCMIMRMVDLPSYCDYRPNHSILLQELIANIMTTCSNLCSCWGRTSPSTSCSESSMGN